MKNKLIALLLALLMAATLAGCANGNEDASTAPPSSTPSNPGVSSADPSSQPAETAQAQPEIAPEDRIPVTLDVWYAVSGESGEAFTRLAEGFDAQSELVSLELSYSGNSADTATKVGAALLGGNQPDVALMYAGPLYTGGRGDFTTARYAQRESFDYDDIFSGMWEYCKYSEGDVCAIPYAISTEVMFYNKEILDAAGEDLSNPPKTWAEFYELCQRLMEKNSGNSGFKAFDVGDAPWLFKTMLMQNGCPVVVSNNGEITPVFNNAEALEVAEFWKSLVDSGMMIPAEHNNAQNKFLSGNLAFIAMSSSRIARWEESASFEVGAIEMPYFKNQSLALGGAVMVILTQDPQRMEAAWDFITYMLAPERTADFSLSSGYLPVRKSAVELPEMKDAIENNPMYSIAFKQLDYTWAYIHFEQMGTMDMQLSNAIVEFEKGVRSPQEALNRALKNLSDEIAEG